MTVKELSEELKNFDDNMTVVFGDNNNPNHYEIFEVYSEEDVDLQEDVVVLL